VQEKKVRVIRGMHYFDVHRLDPLLLAAPELLWGYMTYLTFNVILEPVFGSQQAHCLGFFASSVSKQRHLSRRQTTKEFSWQNQRTTATHQPPRTSPPQKLLHTASFTLSRCRNQTLSQTLSHTEAFTQTFFPSNAFWLSPGRSTRSVACCKEPIN
jgi:hypothetical protein